MSEGLLDRIEIDSEIVPGKPFVRGTRITVEIILEKIAAGCRIEEVLAEYPRLTREDVLAAVAYARGEMLEQLEDLEDLAALEKMRSEVLEFCSLEEFLEDHES